MSVSHREIIYLLVAAAALPAVAGWALLASTYHTPSFLLGGGLCGLLPLLLYGWSVTSDEED